MLKKLLAVTLVIVVITLAQPSAAQPFASPLQSPLEPRYAAQSFKPIAGPRQSTPVNPWGFLYIQSWGQLWHSIR